MTNCLSCSNLSIAFRADSGRPIRVVDDVSFTVPKHGTLGIVGESGCGKSVSALSILKLIPSPPAIIESGSIIFEEHDLLKLREEQIRHIRGCRISMIFQDPMTSLNPVITCGDQIVEAIRAHKAITRSDARMQALELFEKVGITQPGHRLRSYPHELSGGMRQRAMIAMALSCNPTLLIADEPTTALDVTVQARILDLLQDLQAARELSMILISHDLGVVYDLSTNVLVMYAGRVMEYAPARTLFETPLHPYTKNLLQTLPTLAGRQQQLKVIPGDVPSPQFPVAGCPFHPRCESCMARCKTGLPALKAPAADDHTVRCFLYE